MTESMMAEPLTLVQWIGASLFIGTGATLIMDMWALLLKTAFNIPSLNYAMVGRWVGHMPAGRFFHHPVMQSPAVAGEQPLGWFIHYITGIVFAAVLFTVTGQNWLYAPSLLPALLFGITTVLIPFFVMQPGLGFGIAASRTPDPKQARVRSLITHLVFGVGLYLSAELYSGLFMT